MRRSGLATTSGSAGTGPGNDTGVWLIMTIILFALLCNYSRTICLIDVGTEGSTRAHSARSLGEHSSEGGALTRTARRPHPLELTSPVHHGWSRGAVKRRRVRLASDCLDHGQRCQPDSGQ